MARTCICTRRLNRATFFSGHTGGLSLPEAINYSCAFDTFLGRKELKEYRHFFLSCRRIESTRNNQTLTLGTLTNTSHFFENSPVLAFAKSTKILTIELSPWRRQRPRKTRRHRPVVVRISSGGRARRAPTGCLAQAQVCLQKRNNFTKTNINVKFRSYCTCLQRQRVVYECRTVLVHPSDVLGSTAPFPTHIVIGGPAILVWWTRKVQPETMDRRPHDY